MTVARIPMRDLKREFTPIRSEIDDAIERVVERGWFMLGEEVKRFEAEWAAYCGVSHAVGVGNGTDALQLVLRAAGIGPGDQVIVPALTSAFTALAVSMTGATPVFADVDAEHPAAVILVSPQRVGPQASGANAARSISAQCASIQRSGPSMSRAKKVNRSCDRTLAIPSRRLESHSEANACGSASLSKGARARASGCSVLLW